MCALVSDPCEIFAHLDLVKIRWHLKQWIGMRLPTGWVNVNVECPECVISGVCLYT